eukprot:5107422-Karenia_brevis.AAC.1
MALPYEGAIVMQGFLTPALNSTYCMVPDRSSFINNVVVYDSLPPGYFLYWQAQEKRWAICDAAHRGMVVGGEKVGYAYECMTHSGCNPAMLAGRWDWMEWDGVSGTWARRKILVSVMSSEAAGAAIRQAAVGVSKSRKADSIEDTPGGESGGGG